MIGTGCFVTDEDADPALLVRDGPPDVTSLSTEPPIPFPGPSSRSPIL